MIGKYRLTVEFEDRNVTDYRFPTHVIANHMIMAFTDAGARVVSKNYDSNTGEIKIGEECPICGKRFGHD